VGEIESTRCCSCYWPNIPGPDRWWWLWSNWWTEDWQGKPKDSEKTYPSATLSTTNPTWSDPGSNPGRRVRKPAAKRLTCGTAFSPSNTYESLAHNLRLLNYGLVAESQFNPPVTSPTYIFLLRLNCADKTVCTWPVTVCEVRYVPCGCRTFYRMSENYGTSIKFLISFSCFAEYIREDGRTL
jgi:hypothetical protein